MILLLPAFSLILAIAIIGILAILRPRFSYHWLIAVAGALVSWGSLWYIRFQLPLTFGALEGEYAGLALPSLALRADYDNWSLAIALSTLCLAVLFTDVARAGQVSWSVWAGDLGLAALGIVAVLASNLYTLVLAWMALDVIELGILLHRVEEVRIRRQVIIFFSTNLLGTMLVFGAMIAANATGMHLTFSSIPPQTQLYLILAVGLRMGVYPLQAAFLRDPRSQRGEATMLRLVPAASGLSILVHAARVQSSVGLRGVLLGAAALAAVYGAVVWVRSRTELHGRVYWIIGMGGLIFAASAQSQPGAVLAWGLAMVYLGALLFLASSRPGIYISLGIAGVFSLSGLPFSPTYAGMGIYQHSHFFLIFFPVAHILLLVGFVRHMIRQTPPITGVERWVEIIYPAGLILLPLTHLVSVYFNPEIQISGRVAILPLVGMVVVLVILGVMYWRRIDIPEEVFHRLDQVFSLRWIYGVIGWVGNGLRQAASLISILMEGEGGVLWTLVFLLMLVSLLAQITGGAGV